MVNMVDVSNDEQASKPGDFQVVLAGRSIWFTRMNDAQRVTLNRIQRRSRREVDQVGLTEGSFEDKIRAVQDIIDRMYQRMWDAIDATIVEPDDKDFLEEAMLTRQLEMSDAMRVFSEGRDNPPADDAEPAVKTKPARAARKAIPAKAAKKAVANARRVKQ